MSTAPSTGTALTITELPPHLHQQALKVYSKVDNPIEFCEKFGKWIYDSGMVGATNQGQGQLIAMTCLSRGITIDEYMDTYHLIGGKKSMKPEMMLAKFNEMGGQHEWIEQGNDGKKAVLKLSHNGKSLTSEYTFEMAQQAKLVKKDGGWEKNPGPMLRARAISQGIRMFAPTIVAGVYTPDEIESFDDAPTATNGTNGTHTSDTKVKAVRTTKTTVNSIATTEPTTATVAPATTQAKCNDVVEAEFESVNEDDPVESPTESTEQVAPVASPAASNPTPTAETPPIEIDTATHPDYSQPVNGTCSATQVEAIRLLLTEIEKKDPEIRAKIGRRLRDMKKEKVADLTFEQATGLQKALFSKAAELQLS